MSAHVFIEFIKLVCNFMLKIVLYLNLCFGVNFGECCT